jgi:nucleotide-binding universal stress UspA family protein
MRYTTILLHCHDPRRISRLLEAAVPVARDMNAHLIGLGVLPPYVVIPAMDGAGTTMTVEQHRDIYSKDLAQMHAVFARSTLDLPRPAEWREADAGFATAVDRVLDHGRCADLIVAAQADPDWSSSALLEDPERLVLESGRPVMLVPNTGTLTLPPRRITLAWNGRREAARAAFDALALLKGAEGVDVVCINSKQEQPVGTDLPASEICAALARHGVKCQATEATAAGGDVGGELLRQVRSFDADMLVMGCYGHSRLRELVLGGASRHILGRAEVPVLLSH